MDNGKGNNRNNGKDKMPFKPQTPRQAGAGRMKGRFIYDHEGRIISKTQKLLSARQQVVEEAKKPAPVRVLSGMGLDCDFEYAECVLNAQWEICKESHQTKLLQATNDNKTHEPMPKGELVAYLNRKMGAFAKIIKNLPKVESITTTAQMQAYIDDTEALTANLEKYILWKWDNQAVLDMGF
jgi:hypothetical protein